MNSQPSAFNFYQNSPHSTYLTISSKGYVESTGIKFFEETGFQLSDFQTMKLVDRVFPEDREKFSNKMNEVISNKRTDQVATRFFTKNNKLKTYMWKMISIEDSLKLELSEIDYKSFFNTIFNFGDETKTENFTEEKLICQEPNIEVDMTGKKVPGRWFMNLAENLDIHVTSIEGINSLNEKIKSPIQNILKCIAGFFNSENNISVQVIRKDGMLSVRIEDNNQGIIHINGDLKFLVFTKFPNDQFMGDQKLMKHTCFLSENMKGKFWVSSHIKGGNTYYLEVPIE